MQLRLLSYLGRPGTAGRASGFVPRHSSPSGIGDADPAHPFRLRPPGAVSSLNRTLSAWLVRCASEPSLGARGAESSIAMAMPSRWNGALRRYGGGGFIASLPSKPGRASHVIAPAGDALRHKRHPSRARRGPLPVIPQHRNPGCHAAGRRPDIPRLLSGASPQCRESPLRPTGGPPGKGKTDRWADEARVQPPAATRAGSANGSVGMTTRGATYEWTS